MTTGSDLPMVTEVQRLELRPGDRLIVKADDRFGNLSAKDADTIKRKVRAALALPDDFPVLVMAPGLDIAVASAE